MAKKVVIKNKTGSDNDTFLNEVKNMSYVNYLNRIENNLQGDELSDWLSAESKVKSKFADTK